jgi:hypothetical protein
VVDAATVEATYRQSDVHGCAGGCGGAAVAQRDQHGANVDSRHLVGRKTSSCFARQKPLCAAVRVLVCVEIHIVDTFAKPRNCILMCACVGAHARVCVRVCVCAQGQEQPPLQTLRRNSPREVTASATFTESRATRNACRKEEGGGGEGWGGGKRSVSVSALMGGPAFTQRALASRTTRCPVAYHTLDVLGEVMPVGSRLRAATHLLCVRVCVCGVSRKRHRPGRSMKPSTGFRESGISKQAQRTIQGPLLVHTRLDHESQALVVHLVDAEALEAIHRGGGPG